MDTNDHSENEAEKKSPQAAFQKLEEQVRRATDDAAAKAREAAPKVKEAFGKSLRDGVYGFAYASSFASAFVNEFVPEQYQESAESGAAKGRKAAEEASERLREATKQRQDAAASDDSVVVT